MKVNAALAFIVLILLVVLLIESLGLTLSKDVLYKSCQPTEISITAGSSYCVQVVRLNQLIRSNTIVLISNQNADLNYGYVINYPTSAIISNEEFDKIKVDWKPAGIEMKTFWDYTISIPAKNFTRSR